MYTGIIAFSEAGCNYPAQRLATGVPHFCGLNTLVGYGALAEAMARWQAAQVSALITLTRCLRCYFQICYQWRPDVFVKPMLNLLGYLGAFVVVAGAMYSAIGHRLWGRWRKMKRL